MSNAPTRKKFLDTAHNYLGAVELSPVHRNLIDIYNKISPLPRGYKVKYTDAWCAAYVSAVAKESGMENFPYECGVFEMVKKFEKSGSYINRKKQDNEPIICPGDIVFFKRSHVGIITNVDETIVSTIEGNANNKVMQRTYRRNDIDIMGYGMILFPLDLVVEDVINGKYGNGAERRRNLEAQGFDYDTIQAEVNILLKGYQV